MPPVIGAIFPAFGTWFSGLSVLGQALVNLGGSILLQAAAKELMTPPDAGLQGRMVTVRQPAQPRDIVYGQTRKGGTVVYMDVAGWTNEYLDLVIVVAAHKILGVGGVYFNGQMVFAPGSGVAVGQYANHASIEVRLGDPDQPSLTVLTNLSGGKWTPQHRLRGCAHVWIRLLYNPDVYPSGIPNITFDLGGKADIYDPRVGASGYTSNAALCLADYMSNATWGLDAAIGGPDGIDTATLIAAANICDEIVARPDGTTERRYSCDGVINLSQSPKTIIEGMLTAMAGTTGWQAGQWQVFAGAYRPPVITLTDDDIAEGGMQLTTRVSMAENFNAVRGQFISRENDWQPDDFPTYQSAAYLAEDGGDLRFTDINLPFTISPYAAQRLAKITLERQRRQMSVVLTGKLSAWRAAVGDTVNLTYARWGFAAKPFEVRSVEMVIADDNGAPKLVPNLVLRETSPLVYDWTATEADIYAVAPRTNLPSPFNIPPPSALAVTEELYQTLPGSGVKALARISWAASPSAMVREYQLEARIGSAPWRVIGRTEDLSMDIADIVPGTWSFRVRAISQANVSSFYTTITQEVFGLKAPPAAIANLTVQSTGGAAILKWEQSRDLDVLVGGRIVIRHSAATTPAWANSAGMDIVAGSQANAVVPLKPGAYLVRAEDSSGNAGPVSMASVAGVQAVPFLPVTTLTEDPAFSGAKVSVAASGGVLSLDSGLPIDIWPDFDAVVNIDAEGGILPIGTYTFASGMDFGSVRTVRLQSQIDLGVTDLTATFDARPGSIDSWVNFDGADGGEVDAVVEVRTTPDDPGGAPVWSSWSRADATDVIARGVQARLVLTSADANFSPAVTLLRLQASVAQAGWGVEAP